VCVSVGFTEPREDTVTQQQMIARIAELEAQLQAKPKATRKSEAAPRPRKSLPNGKYIFTFQF